MFSSTIARGSTQEVHSLNMAFSITTGLRDYHGNFRMSHTIEIIKRQ